MSQSRPRGIATAANDRSNRRATARAITARASRLSVIISTSRLRSNMRASSSRRPSASAVRARATADRLLATRLTARNAKSATQLCGSAIVKVPTGGRKKKFRHSIATSDVMTAIARRDVAATMSTHHQVGGRNDRGVRYVKPRPEDRRAGGDRAERQPEPDGVAARRRAGALTRFRHDRHRQRHRDAAGRSQGSR